ncbi:MAG TPA: TusE/DsrC/DsvC family sulfur relay protein [Nitrospirota bacterium]|nr:TusE/DsrC/DsvC family sulfur relay protein [Nitrospirota bacterium]
MTVLDYIEVKNRKISIDREGYLVNYDDWNESVASALAEREGVDKITDDKLTILKFIRWYYKEYNFFPMLSAVCKNVNKPRDCVFTEFYNPILAWKIAGLPHPEEPLISFLKAGQSPG